MSRDLSRFPQDENGDVLWRMHDSGDDLSKIREVDFSVVFPTEQQALDFSVRVLRAGHRVQQSRFMEQPEGLTWDVSVSSHMVPTHLQVTQFELFLADAAMAHGGRNDGWGCFAQA